MNMDVKARQGHSGSELGRAYSSGPTNGNGACVFAAPRVVTFTPAPCIDKVYFLDRVRTGEVNRANKADTYFAGNGVNVARALHLAGNTVSAVLPIDGEWNVDGSSGTDLLSMVRGIDVGVPLRTNVTIVDETGMTTNINSLPAPLDPGQWSSLCQAVIQEVQRLGADWFVLGGSLPLDANTGATVDIQPLFRTLRSLGVSVCLDSPVGHNALSDWSRGGFPDLVKPNAEELSLMTGSDIRCLGDVVDAANRVRAVGVGTVLTSLGSDGILESGPQGVRWARGPQTHVINTTGAGDAALAGYLSVAHPDSPESGWHDEALKRAVSWGALAVRQATTVLPHVVKGPYEVLIGLPSLDHQLA